MGTSYSAVYYLLGWVRNLACARRARPLGRATKPRDGLKAAPYIRIDVTNALLRSRGSGGGLRQTEKVGEQFVRAGGAGGQLTPQAETEIEPAAFADAPFDQRAELLARIVLE